MSKIIELLNKPKYLYTTVDTLIMLLVVLTCFIILGLIAFIIILIRNKIINKIIINRAKRKEDKKQGH
jgi:uncharacterized membrane protein required for colicin V production